ncbi:MAG: hypothetical protein RLZZ600_225 [Actinomycetota bacterium]|jgi:DNA-binding NarL/FixJ family response regulator
MTHADNEHWSSLVAHTRKELDPAEAQLRRVLTPRQLQILRMVADGLTNKGISDDLGITINSVVNHLGAVYLALEIPEDANSRVQATLDYLTSTGQLNPKS